MTLSLFLFEMNSGNNYVFEIYSNINCICKYCKYVKQIFSLNTKVDMVKQRQNNIIMHINACPSLNGYDIISVFMSCVHILQNGS